MNVAEYRRLRAWARRHTRRAQDADDLVQDVLVVALETGRFDAPWLEGVMRNQAALRARSALRRRRREAAVAPVDQGNATDDATTMGATGEAQRGLVRRALRAALQSRAGLGTHDADGHLIVIRGRRAARGSGSLRHRE